MRPKSNSNFNLTIYFIFLLLSSAILLFSSIDSPLHTSFRHVDSAWFFMEGKAWMEGMIPYLDFADSKGPFLFLFYGIAYLISPTNYWGVYMLHCIYFSFVFYVAYLVGHNCLFASRNSNQRILLSFCGAALLGLFYFTYRHNEMRCEDICQLQLLYLIYSLCCHMLSVPKTRSITYGLLDGVAIGSALLIKWNIGIAFMAIPIANWIIVLIRRENLVKVVSGFFLGLFIILIPFIMYFLSKGCLHMFVNEYILHTGQTFSNSDTGLINAYLNELRLALTSSSFLGFVAMFVPIWFFRHLDWRLKYLPTCCGLFMFFFLTIGKGGLGYYHQAEDGWFVFSTCILAIVIQRLVKRSFITIAISILLVLSFNIAWAFRYHRNLIYGSEAHSFTIVDNKLRQLKYPLILHWDYFETGIGIGSRALPACRYWAMQTGGEEFCRPMQIDAVLRRIPDIITVQSMSPASIASDKAEILHRLGYQYVGSIKDWFGCYGNIYVKRELSIL